MKIAFLLVTFLFFMMLINNVLACPASIPELLFVKETKMASDVMKFIDTDMNLLSEGNYSHQLQFLPRIAIDEKYDNSTFEIILKQNSGQLELFKNRLLFLKREAYHYGREKKYAYFEFPREYFYKSLRTIDSNLSHFDTNLLIFKLDGFTIREYVIGYQPALIYHCPSNSFYGPFTRLGIIVFILVVVMALILMRITIKR